jgi:hypothetical protein
MFKWFKNKKETDSNESVNYENVENKLVFNQNNLQITLEEFEEITRLCTVLKEDIIKTEQSYNELVEIDNAMSNIESFDEMIVNGENIEEFNEDKELTKEEHDMFSSMFSHIKKIISNKQKKEIEKIKENLDYKKEKLKLWESILSKVQNLDNVDITIEDSVKFNTNNNIVKVLNNTINAIKKDETLLDNNDEILIKETINKVMVKAFEKKC